MFSINAQLERDSATRQPETYLRENRRHKTSSVVLITNLGQPSMTGTGVLLDFSTNGMRIETPLSFHLGDSVRVEAGNHIELGEIIHRTSGSVGVEVGLKLVHSLNREDLVTFLQPPWAELVDSPSRSRPPTGAPLGFSRSKRTIIRSFSSARSRFFGQTGFCCSNEPQGRREQRRVYRSQFSCNAP